MIWSIYILLFANNVLGLFQIYKLGFTPTVIRIILNFRVWLIPSPCSCTIHPCCWCESPFICDLHFASCRSWRNELPCIWIHENSNNPWDPILRIASFFLYLSRVVYNWLEYWEANRRCCARCATAWWAVSYERLDQRWFWQDESFFYQLFQDSFFLSLRTRHIVQVSAELVEKLAGWCCIGLLDGWFARG